MNSARPCVMPFCYKCLLLLLFFATSTKATTIEKGFKALTVYDYFKAKSLFYDCQNNLKTRAAAAYGLAIIYYRNDNPFTNGDSATKYINLSYATYLQNPLSTVYVTYSIDGASILQLCDSIAKQEFQKAFHLNQVAAFDHFLFNNYLCQKSLKKKAIRLRDELEYNYTIRANKSDSTEVFIQMHPQSYFLTEALLLKDRQLYEELTASNSDEAYKVFLIRYPRSRMASTAYEKLFDSYSSKSNTRGLAYFVRTYPYAPQTLEAWKLLFSLTVKDYTYTELKRFLEEYPDFPLKNSIFKELELNKLELFLYQQGEYFGFVDQNGKTVIPAIYETATEFHEGLSVVSKNDSTYFINKENANAFSKLFNEAQVFRNGLAPVKLKDRWYFINRQGQIISEAYEDMNELSDGYYVFKIHNQYGALDMYGQTKLEAKYDKLGDFKNGFAYYIENGMYGFVSKKGEEVKPLFEWISDFNEQHIAVVKLKGQYGLVNATGQVILEAVYDQILKTNSRYFIPVSHGLYGFYNSSGCFMTAIQYDFAKEKPAEFYTDGQYFKLLKNEQQSLLDENGTTVFPFKQYNEVNFPSQKVFRVKKQKKYGYVDSKNNLLIPFKFESAGDFSDSLALVYAKERVSMITLSGLEIFGSEFDVEKISTNYYLLHSEMKRVVNKKGQEVFKEVWGVQKCNSKCFIITFHNGEIKLICD